MKTNPDLRERALRHLARREYSRSELRTRLLHHAGDFNHPTEEDVDVLLDDLVKSGYLSDARAATQLLHARRSRFGSQRIVHEMHHKGIAGELIEAALPELQESELDTAQAVWRKKFGALPHDAREKARQIRFLQARGFGLEVIMKVLHTVEMKD